MSRYSCALISIALLALSAMTCHAAPVRDLPRSDPQRSAILDAARPDPSARFVVRDLFVEEDLAYLCALTADTSGDIQSTDESLEVSKFGLYRLKGQWRAARLSMDFTGKVSRTDCRMNGAVVSGAGTIRQLIAEATTDEVRQSLDFFRPGPVLLEKLADLRAAHILESLDIEHPKAPLDPVQLQVAQEHCPTPACRAQVTEAYGWMNAHAADASVSSLVWAQCGYGLRAFALGAVKACIVHAAPLPQCRPHLSLPQDVVRISQCVRVIHDACPVLFTDAGQRRLVCSFPEP